jgi:hypothetical protein
LKKATPSKRGKLATGGGLDPEDSAELSTSPLKGAKGSGVDGADKPTAYDDDDDDAVSSILGFPPTHSPKKSPK